MRGGVGKGPPGWTHYHGPMSESDRCPYCLADLDAMFGGEREPVVHCADCGTAHHQACFAEYGRCTLLGCPGVTTQRDPPPSRRPGSLSPFTPLGKPRMVRQPGFLSVVRERVDALTSGRGRLELRAPARVTAGEPLDLEVALIAPKTLQLQGLRLAVESALDGRPRRALLHEEAVLVGRPRGDWLSRLRLAGAPPVPIKRGRHRFGLRLDTARLLWRGPAPEGRLAAQILTLRLSAEGRGGPKDAQAHVQLLDGRRLPPDRAGDGAEVPEVVVVPPLPPPATGWAPRPVVGDDATRPLAVAFAHHTREGDSRVLPDTLELEARLITRAGVLAVAATLRMDLHHGLRGELRLLAESSFVASGRKHSAGLETVLLARGGGEAGGVHALEVEYPIPAVIAAGRGHRRSVALRAELTGEGKPLRTGWVKLALPKR